MVLISNRLSAPYFFPRLSRWIGRLPSPAFTLLATTSAFFAYFAIYGFRKPFLAGAYEGEFLGSGLALKTAMVLSQVFGYAVSKFIGVKICSEAGGRRRGLLLIAFAAASLASLVLFALVPGPWKIVAIFLSGLPLGMVWGLVVSYLEGRRCSDIVLAGLCGSLIISSGMTRDVGLWLMNSGGVAESWMPATAGLIFLPVFALAVGALAHLPPPTVMDEAMRCHREPMDKQARHGFLRRFFPGLLVLIAFSIVLTAYRDYRDSYGVEIFTGLGYGGFNSGLFTKTEIPAAIGALLGLTMINWIKDNRRALMASFAIMLTGMILLLVSTLMFKADLISGLAWMIATGLGTYLAYIPFFSVFFERLMAATGSAGTAVFGIQLVDAFGYAGSVGVQLYKDLGQPSLSRLVFFEQFSLVLSIAGVLLLLPSAVYFHHRAHPLPEGGK